MVGEIGWHPCVGGIGAPCVVSSLVVLCMVRMAGSRRVFGSGVECGVEGLVVVCCTVDGLLISCHPQLGGVCLCVVCIKTGIG